MVRVIRLGSALVLAACTAAPAQRSPPLLPSPDASYEGAACELDAGPVVHTACDGTGWRECAGRAESLLPGWEAVSACDATLGCVNGTTCGVDVEGGGIDGGGAARSYCCGEGPACAAGDACARPFGGSEPFRCVCARATSIEEVDGARCPPDASPAPSSSGDDCTACVTWAAALAPSGTTGLAACRHIAAHGPCIRASECPRDGSCRCGDGPPCGDGEVCVRTASGAIGCVCEGSRP
jgi:hypothetical protein